MDRRSFLKSIGPALAAVVALPKALAGDRRKATSNTNMLNGRRATDTWRSGPATDSTERWQEAIAMVRRAPVDQVAIDQPWQRDPNAFHIMGPTYRRLFVYRKHSDGWYRWMELWGNCSPEKLPEKLPEPWQLDRAIMGTLSSVSVTAINPVGMLVGVRHHPDLRDPVVWPCNLKNGPLDPRRYRS